MKLASPISNLSHQEALDLLEKIKNALHETEDAGDFCLWLIQDVLPNRVDVVDDGKVIGQQG